MPCHNPPPPPLQTPKPKSTVVPLVSPINIIVDFGKSAARKRGKDAVVSISANHFSRGPNYGVSCARHNTPRAKTNPSVPLPQPIIATQDTTIPRRKHPVQVEAVVETGGSIRARTQKHRCSKPTKIIENLPRRHQARENKRPVNSNGCPNHGDRRGSVVSHHVTAFQQVVVSSALILCS